MIFFVGMFSPDRLLSAIGGITGQKKDYLGPIKWETLFEEIIQTIYFKESSFQMVFSYIFDPLPLM